MNTSNNLESLDVIDDRRVLGVSIRRLGHVDDPKSEVIVEIQLSDGSYVELGRELLGGNFSHCWSLEKWTRHLKTASGLPIRQMLKDASLAWTLVDRGQEPYLFAELLGDLSCHVRALVEEVERLERLIIEAKKRGFS